MAAFGAGGALWSAHEIGRAAGPSTDKGIADTGRIDIRAFGARGDRRTDDLDPIRQAIARANQSDQYPSSIFIPAGNYRRRDSIALPNHACLFGEGVSSILNSQNDASFNKPILINQSPAGLIAARLQDLTLYGGSHGLRLDAQQENADLRLHNVGMLLQSTANIEANKLLQTVKMSNCILGSAPYGIRVAGTGTNCLLATGSEWLDHSESSIFLRGADGITVIGGRFEGGGRVGRYCLDIENASNITFVGCFFENVHEFLARFRQISGAVVFQSCHFSGTSLGKGELRPFRWDTGEETVVFRDCVSVYPMPVGGYVMLEGSNSGIIARDVLFQGNAQSGQFVVNPRPGAPGRPVITIDAPSEAGEWQVNGELTLQRHPGPSNKILVTVTPDSRDAVLAVAPRAVRLMRAGPRRWAVAMDTGSNNFGYAFDWNIVTTSTLPTIRAPLT